MILACKIAATVTADNLGQRATHAGRCHWSEGRHNNGGGLLQERRATMQVMLGVSLRTRWDATLVTIMNERTVQYITI